VLFLSDRLARGGVCVGYGAVYGAPSFASDPLLIGSPGSEPGSANRVAGQAGGSLASPIGSPVVPVRRGGQSPPPYHSPVTSQIS
jgi:hypothetical protein